jgi:hypothetical protein
MARSWHFWACEGLALLTAEKLLGKLARKCIEEGNPDLLRVFSVALALVDPNKELSREQADDIFGSIAGLDAGDENCVALGIALAERIRNT